MQVSVRDNNVDQALRALKKKLQREGVFREMKLKQHFEKPSEKKAREKAEAQARTEKSSARRSALSRPGRKGKRFNPCGPALRGFNFSGSRVLRFARRTQSVVEYLRMYPGV